MLSFLSFFGGRGCIVFCLFIKKELKDKVCEEGEGPGGILKGEEFDQDIFKFKFLF